MTTNWRIAGLLNTELNTDYLNTAPRGVDTLTLPWPQPDRNPDLKATPDPKLNPHTPAPRLSPPAWCPCLPGTSALGPGPLSARRKRTKKEDQIWLPDENSSISQSLATVRLVLIFLHRGKETVGPCRPFYVMWPWLSLLYIVPLGDVLSIG